MPHKVRDCPALAPLYPFSDSQHMDLLLRGSQCQLTRERLRAEAHNAMMIVARGMALPLRDRLRISTAILHAVEPLITPA